MKFMIFVLTLLALQIVSAKVIKATANINIVSPLAGAQDFTTRCAQPGVVRCFSFDTDADFVKASGPPYSFNFGLAPINGTNDFSKSIRDTSIKASGTGSLKFIIPSLSGSDTSGAFFANFSSDLSVQFDGGSEFFVQWRQRFSSDYIATKYAGAGGFKQVIIGTGDQPNKSPFYSCSSLEVVATNYYQSGFPILYNSCSGSESHGPYDGFYQSFGAYDFKLQNARPAPYCLYSQSNGGYLAPNGNCFGYVANEWMTFQIHIKLGPRVNNEFKNSFVTMWASREGRASEPVIEWGPYNLSAGTQAEQEKFGKVWLTPYNTGKDGTVSYPEAYTWYDDLIISRNKIADPK